MKTAIVWLLISVYPPVVTVAILPSFTACESLKERIDRGHLKCYQSEIVINQDLASPGIK